MNSSQVREFKDELFEQFARITKALANPKRLEIVDVLAQSERTVESLAKEIGQSIANTSQHLQTLKAARLVEVRRDGTYGYYRLAHEEVGDVWRSVRALGEARLAEVEQVVEAYDTNRESLDTVTLSELLDRLEREELTIVDVRPSEEYLAGHIRGALSVPVRELSERLGELPEGKRVVAYCRGPYCVFADEAVALLRSQGIDATRLREGFPDWRAAGLPSERGVS